MSYSLEALVGQRLAFAAMPAPLPSAYLVPLAHDFFLLPVTDTVIAALSAQPLPSTTQARPQFRKLSPCVEAWACHASRLQPIAYLEADYWAGRGTQSSIVWYQGTVIRGPLHKARAINRALRAVGVQRTQHDDHFTVLGLAQHCSTEAWLPPEHEQAGEPGAAPGGRAGPHDALPDPAR